MKGSKEKRENAELNFISAGIGLIQQNVPAVAIWKHNGTVHHVGSCKMSEWFKNLDIETKEKLNTALKGDELNIIENNEPLLNNNPELGDREKAEKIVMLLLMGDNFHPSGLQLLPYPLDLMNKREKIKYLSDRMIQEAKTRTSKLTVKIAYGEDESRPSFWIEEFWSWENVTQSLHTIKDSMYTGPETWNDFLTKCMKKLLQSHNMDPETDVYKIELKTKTLERKRKQKGIVQISPAKVVSEDPQVKVVSEDTQYIQVPGNVSDEEVSEDTQANKVYYDAEANEVSEEIINGEEFVEFCADETFDLIADYNQNIHPSIFPSPLPTSDSIGGDCLNSLSVISSSCGVSDTASISAEPVTFTPRRAVGDSPFKLGRSCKKLKVRSRMFDEEEKSPEETRLDFYDVPVAFSSQLTECVIQSNTGIESSLFKASMQHIKADNFTASEEGFESLKRHSYSKLVEWWPNFDLFYNWPMEVNIGSGISSEVIIMQDAEMFKTFLLSEESLHFTNNPEVDLCILAYCLNTHIYVLSSDNNTGLGETHWKTFAGSGVVLPTEFSTNTSNLWLVTEDGLNFNRAVAKREECLLVTNDASEHVFSEDCPPETEERDERDYLDIPAANEKIIKSRIKKPKLKKKVKRLDGMTEDRKKKFNRKVAESFETEKSDMNDPKFEAKIVQFPIKDLNDNKTAKKSQIYHIYSVKKKLGREIGDQVKGRTAGLGLIKNFAGVWGNTKPSLKGLRNLGNTCYINSILQCVSNITPLSHYFVSGNYEQDLNTTSSTTNGQIAVQFSNVLRNLFSPQLQSISPSDLKLVAGKFKAEYSSRGQQDSHEFLSKLLEWLHNDTNILVTPNEEPEQNNQSSQEDITAARCHWSNFLERHQSIIVQLFSGQTRSTVRCLSCMTESVTYTHFSNLTLPLPRNLSKVSLTECFEEFLREENIDYFCESCKINCKATKKTDVVKLPAVLVLHLCRFYQDSKVTKKKQTLVDFELKSVNLGQFAIEGFDNKFDLFDLAAVSNHFGTLRRGHYTAYCSSTVLNRWYKFDDENVSAIDPGDVVSPAAYVLFFSAIERRTSMLDD